MNNPEFTILMPCLNESRTIGICLEKACKFMRENKLSYELLVVDNGSLDNSKDIARTYGARVIEEKKRGYGNALRKGIKYARGKYIIMGDCDDSYDFYNIGKIVEGLRKGYLLVVGNRFMGGIEKGAMPFSHRYLGVPILSGIGRIKYNVSLTDFHCGMRGLLTSYARNLDFTSGGMEFATEMIALFSNNKEKILEVPLHFYKDGRKGPSHLRSIRDGIRHIKYMVL